MKSIIKKINLLLLLGVIAMTNNHGYAGDFNYTRYESRDPELNISIDYLEGWICKEQRGPENKFVNILFFENRKDKDYKAFISVTVENLSAIAIKPLTIEALADDLITKRAKFKDAKLLSKAKKEILGLEVQDITMSYQALDKLHSLDAKVILVKEGMIIFIRDNKFYTIQYQNRESEFDRFSQAFSHIIETMRFQDGK
ncbi:MAG: hypothetical protein A3J51_00695 [Omnitrophica WOR_2 bacterium RIFCSPHIGHO2_02_FULL_45_21]|nr:MAG: hypothetical protein A3J51_00695 [Omnitrophica WOR_2 bacterium RIFCSPHIGHO2_02_FULL_45_21]